ncbi:MAG: hypothetical protein ABI583_01165 [Betaproteobacteria bacterium]
MRRMTSAHRRYLAILATVGMLFAQFATNLHACSKDMLGLAASSSNADKPALHPGMHCHTGGARTNLSDGGADVLCKAHCSQGTTADTVSTKSPSVPDLGLSIIWPTFNSLLLSRPAEHSSLVTNQTIRKRRPLMIQFCSFLI